MQKHRLDANAAFNAYLQARNSTPTLAYALIAAMATMLARDLDTRITIAHGSVAIRRDPADARQPYVPPISTRAASRFNAGNVALK